MAAPRNATECAHCQIDAFETMCSDYAVMREMIGRSPLVLADAFISLRSLTGQVVCPPSIFPLSLSILLLILRIFYWRMTIMKSPLRRVLSLFQLSTTAIVFEPISLPIIFLSITILCPNMSANGSGSKPTRHGTSTLFRYVVCNLPYFCL